MNAKPSKKRSKTNWNKVKVQSDSDIDTSEIPALDADFFKSAILRMPSKKASITVRLDSDVLEWFRMGTHRDAVGDRASKAINRSYDD